MDISAKRWSEVAWFIPRCRNLEKCTQVSDFISKRDSAEKITKLYPSGNSTIKNLKSKKLKTITSRVFINQLKFVMIHNICFCI